jgi:hypothetical protein
MFESFQVELAEAPRQDAYRQEEVGPTGYPARAIWGQAPGGQDAVQVWVVTTTLTIP